MTLRNLWLTALCSLTLVGVPLAQEDDIVYDDDVKVVAFEGFLYPPIANSARVEGDVVVVVTMNDDGSVRRAVALSGPRLLIAASVEGARKWKFAPNRQCKAILIYEFRFAEGVCWGDGAKSLFQKVGPNRARITVCAPPVNVEHAR